MKNLFKIATLALAVVVMTLSALAQEPATPLTNLTEGVGTVTGQNLNWAGYSELVLIPGSGLFGVKSSTSTLAIGFTSGSTVDIGNMVLYTTVRNTTTVTKTAPVKLGGVSNPSINLTNPATCSQPVSVTNPCIVKLDAVKGQLSPLNDYYFTIFFTNDSNNQSVGAAGPSSAQGSVSGYFILGDETRIKKKGTLPTGFNAQAPYFLMSLTNQ